MTTYLFQEPVLLSCITLTMAQILCLGDGQFKKRITSLQNHFLSCVNLETEKRRVPVPKKKSSKIVGKVEIA